MFKPRMFILLMASFLSASQTTLTVKEWMGVSRTKEPVSGGVAFPKGVVPSVSQLTLFQGATEIPVQCRLLVPHTDGSVQWVLVDFTDAFSANEEKNYTLKVQSPAARPGQTITVTRNNSVITINNGILSVSFDTVNFKGIESLVYNGKSMISGAGGLSVHDIVKGAPDTNGTVTNARMIYSGPLRVTYRVEGEFYRAAAGGLGYAYSITVYAGSPRVTIDASIRNSINAQTGRTAKIRRAFASFKLGFDPAATISYDTLAGYKQGNYGYTNDTIRSTRAYEDNVGTGLSVTEKYNGGRYSNFMSRTLRNGRTLEVDMIMPLEDSTYRAWNSAISSHVRNTIPFNYILDSSNGSRIYVLPDCAHKYSQITLECYMGGLSPFQLRARMRAMKHRLIPRQAPADLSVSGGLSLGRFGTLEDETASHAKWGWAPSNPSTITYGLSQFRPDIRADNCPHQDINTHTDQENDYLQAFLLQWVRYGERGFFDEGQAVAHFYTGYWTYRTTDFEWDGYYAAPAWIRAAARRTTQTLGFDDVGPRVDINGRPASADGCHFFAHGLTDYYCLTGDPEVLEACKDLYEPVKVYLWQWGGGVIGPADTANSNVNLSDRSVNRKLGYAIRLYDITKDPVMLGPMRHYMRAGLKYTKLDPYFWIKKPYINSSAYGYTSFANYKLPDSVLQYLRSNRLSIDWRKDKTYYEQCWMVDSVSNSTWPVYLSPLWMGLWIPDFLENWMLLFPDDDDVRDFLIGSANYYTKTMSGYCGHGTYSGVLSDFPRKGMYSAGYHPNFDTLQLYQWMSSHAKCKSEPRGSFNRLHYEYIESLMPATMIAGYRHTGFSYFLQQAQKSWGYAAVPYYNLSPYATAPEPATQAGSYARLGVQGWYGFTRDDYLSKTVPLFYETVHRADTLPPGAVTDLSVSRLSGNAGLLFRWTAPPGGAVSYQLKYFKGKPLADYPEIDYKNIDTNSIPWWFARNVVGEPVPASPGSPESFTVTGSFSMDSVYYAATCSRDTMNNLSRISNIVRIDNTTAEESVAYSRGHFTLNACPNPFNPAVQLTAQVPSEWRQRVTIHLFDLSGRLVASFDGSPVSGRFKASWNGKDNNGRVAASGIFLARMKAGEKTLVKTIMMAK